MLEQYFSDARAIRRHREGPLGSRVDGFVGWLSGQGYARDSVRFFVAVFSDLGRWLHRRKLGNVWPFRGLNCKWPVSFIKLPHCSTHCFGPYKLESTLPI